MKKYFLGNPLKIFYLVFGYIVLFSIWWAILLYRKNESAFTEKIELNKIYFNPQKSVFKNYEDTQDYHNLIKKYQRQKIMILTEGGVFLVLLILGLLQVRRTFLKEIDLAKQQNNFLLSITHELKSPLASIKLSLQTILKRKLEEEQKSKLLGNSVIDVQRLEELVENILFAAKIEKNNHGFSDEDIPLSEVANACAERFFANKKRIKFELKIQEKIYYLVDRLGFISVLNNLLENSIKYSEENTTVQIILTQTNEQIILKIADEGYGISAEEKLKVFERFYRIGNEETRKSKGTGLGLYIVKRFVEIYKGQILITDNLPKGTIFTLIFPLIK